MCWLGRAQCTSAICLRSKPVDHDADLDDLDDLGDLDDPDDQDDLMTVSFADN